MKGKNIGYSQTVNTLPSFFIYVLRTMDPSRSKFEDPQENLNLGLEASEYIHNKLLSRNHFTKCGGLFKYQPRHVNRVFYGMFGTTFSKALTLLRFSYAKKNIRARLDGASKIISLPVSKNDKTASLFLLGKRFCFLCSFLGVNIHGGAILKSRP